MSHPPEGDLTVRHAATPAEIDDFYRAAWSVFGSGENPDEAMEWRDFRVQAPGFDPSQIRCAFRGQMLVGGCLVYERVLRMGPARLRTACIGGVWTHPSHRHQGVASAVLRDATAYAQERRHALLLLDGIADFYPRFGYVDVHDVVWHAVERQRALGHPPSAYQVRSATPADAPALLSLYQRHYGRYSGSFERSLEEQAHQLRHASPNSSPSLALAPDGTPRGYIAFNWEHHGARAAEVAADDWPAALALLQRHAHLFDGQADPPTELLWPLPTDSPTYHTLADRLPLRTRVDRRPGADWMARPAHETELFRSLGPLWQERWRRAGATWSGRLGIRLGSDESAVCTLDLSPGRVDLAERRAEANQRVELSPGAFTQLLFGFRPVDWLAQQPGQRIPGECRRVLEALFPPEPFWIAGSDAF